MNNQQFMKWYLELATECFKGRLERLNAEIALYEMGAYNE